MQSNGSKPRKLEHRKLKIQSGDIYLQSNKVKLLIEPHRFDKKTIESDPFMSYK
jgi:hypothetical protein